MVVFRPLLPPGCEEARLRTSMATGPRAWRARHAGFHIRIHHPRLERLVDRRTWSCRRDADERLNRFGEEHARTRARERARDDQRGTVEPLWSDGRRGEEPVVQRHRGTGRPLASSRGTGRPHPGRAARRREDRQEGRRQEDGRRQHRRRPERGWSCGRAAGDAHRRIGRRARCCDHVDTCSGTRLTGSRLVSTGAGRSGVTARRGSGACARCQCSRCQCSRGQCSRRQCPGPCFPGPRRLGPYRLGPRHVRPAAGADLHGPGRRDIGPCTARRRGAAQDRQRTSGTARGPSAPQFGRRPATPRRNATHSSGQQAQRNIQPAARSASACGTRSRRPGSASGQRPQPSAPRRHGARRAHVQHRSSDPAASGWRSSDVGVRAPDPAASRQRSTPGSRRTPGSWAAARWSGRLRRTPRWTRCTPRWSWCTTGWSWRLRRSAPRRLRPASGRTRRRPWWCSRCRWRPTPRRWWRSAPRRRPSCAPQEESCSSAP